MDYYRITLTLQGDLTVYSGADVADISDVGRARAGILFFWYKAFNTQILKVMPSQRGQAFYIDHIIKGILIVPIF